MTGKKMLALFLVLGLAGVLLIGASMNFAGDLVAREAGKAVKDLLGADLSIAEIRGNPLKGFTTGKIDLVKEGKSIFSAGFLEIRLKLLSLLRGSPKLKILSVGGVKLDADRLAAEIAKMDFKGRGSGEIPIETLRIVESTVESKWAKADVKSASLSFSGKDISTEVDLSVNSVPIRGKVSVLIDGSAVDLRSLGVDVGKGRLSGSGRVAPDLSVKGDVKNLDIRDVLAFWPAVQPDGFEGKASLSFSGEGKWNAPSLKGDLDYSGKSILGFPVESVKTKWAFAGEKLSLSDLTARVLGIPLQGAMSLVLGQKAPVLDLSLSGTGVSLSELKKIDKNLGDLSGEIDRFSVRIAGSTDSLSGTADFSAPRLGAFGYNLSGSVVQVKIAPRTASVSGKSSFEGAPVTLQGTISDYLTAPKMNLSGTVRAFNLARAASMAPGLKDLSLGGALNADLSLKGNPAAPEVSGKAWSDRITAKKETVESPAVTFSLKGKSLVIPGASAKWRGAGLSASGTAAFDGKLNMSVTAENIQPGAIAPFFPAISGYGIRGSVTARAAITGTTSAPKIDLTLTSPGLELLDAVALKNIKAETSISGDPKALEKMDLDLGISAGSASLGGIPLSDLGIRVKKSGNTVNIPSASAKMGKGTASGSGKAVLGSKPGEEGSVDFSVRIAGADLAAIAAGGKLGVQASGTVDGTVSLKGNLENPAISVKASSPRTSVSGMTATDVSLALSGSMKEMKVEEFRAKFGGGSLSAGGIVKMGTSPDVTIDLEGKDLDLASLVSGMPEARELGVSGKANVSFKGRFAGASGRGSGSISSKGLTVLGLKASNLSYPIFLEGNSLSGRGASVSFYGGSVKGSGNLDLETLKFSHRTDFEGVDVNALLQDFTGGMDGKITGTAKGTVNLAGAFAPKLSYSGKGNASMGAGAVSGFKAVKVLSALYGSSGIRYSGVEAPFRLETGRVFLEKGTRANAPQNDPLYRFFTAEGTVGPKGALNLQCAGNANIQLVNALAGGAAGGISGSTLQDALKGVLGGIRGGMEKNDFRDISFTLRGTTDDPDVSNLKVAQAKPSPQTAQPAPSQSSPKTPSKTGEQKPMKPEDALKEKLLDSIFKK